MNNRLHPVTQLMRSVSWHVSLGTQEVPVPSGICCKDAKRHGQQWCAQAALDAFEEREDGRVEQVKPDSGYLHPVPLGRAHQACVARARQKAVRRKAESMRLLALPGGAHVEFSKASRAALDPRLIQRIR